MSDDGGGEQSHDLPRARAWRRSPAAQQLEFYAYRLLRVVPALHRRLTALFVADAQRLNDTLATSPLDGRWWIWGGMVLGWAREGHVLPFDDMDLDLAVLARDWPLLEASVTLIEEAGFRGVRRFRNHRGEVTELTFLRHGARFEFFKLWDADDALCYAVYGVFDGTAQAVERTIPRQEWDTFEFLGRTWRKSRDHEGELEHLYGDWRTPDAGWSYMAHGASELARRPWDPATSAW
ncbi:MAG: hypothetical protein ACYCSX_12400 [Acidimicrobiales bacterium]